MPPEVNAALVEQVRPLVTRHTRRTPVLRSAWLSSRLGTDVYLKCENLQFTGSFKIRGGLAAVSLLSDDARARGVVAASAGNHGLGLARACSLLGVSCTVVVPKNAPRVKEQGIRDEGAEVILSPHFGYDDTQDWTLEHLDTWPGTFVSPFEDPGVMAGNGGTLTGEILEELPEVKALVVPCGGGGLAVGSGVMLREHGRGARLIGVNTEASPGMWLSRADGRAHLRVDGRPTIADGSCYHFVRTALPISLARWRRPEVSKPADRSRGPPSTILLRKIWRIFLSPALRIFGRLTGIGTSSKVEWSCF